MKKNKAIQIGMVALVTLFGGGTGIAPVNALPVTQQVPTSQKDVVLPTKSIKPDDKKAVIPIRGNGFGEDYLFPSIATSPIWYGRSQRKKHTSSVSRDRRMKKRKNNR